MGPILRPYGAAASGLRCEGRVPVYTNIQDLRARARRRVPRAIYDYADRGSYDEVTIRRNRSDLEALVLRQRVMIDVSKRSTKTNVLGMDWTIPVGIAPVGLTGLFYPNGEIHGARAAKAFGVPFTLSTVSICSIEDVAAAVDMPFWFQLYVMRDRGFVKSLIERAQAAKCGALVLTLDLQVQGQRHRDIKNGLSVPPKLTLANAIDIATKPEWAFGVLRGKRKTFGNLADRLPQGKSLKTLSEWINSQFDPTLSWKDVAWVRDLWKGPLILKGVLNPEDARHAVEAGADAIVVSNHGGRQLDGARSSISALPGVVDAVAGRAEILFDGGVQSGQDVLRAVALGAKGCLIGKSYIWSLAAGGQAGVTRALSIIRDELSVSMALTGITDIADASKALEPRGNQ
jgi:L-lactate dehydrogenase (cytochrome)